MVDRNQSDLLGIIATGLADNTSGAITAQVLRDIMTDTVDTIFTVTSASGATTTAIGAADGETSIVLGNGSGIHFAAGTNVTTTLSDAGNGSGVVTIGLGPLGSAENPNGLMSSFKFGSVDANGQGQRLTVHDSSGIMLKAGSNMSIDFGGYSTADSGVFTFNAVLPSGNAITSVSAGGDTGYTWTSQNDIVAEGAGDTLSLVAGTGIRLDTDATNDAIRFSVSGSLPLSTHPSTSPASSSDNAANTFIQDITLDAYGHITAIGTNTVPSGNYHPIIDSSNRLDASLIGSNGDVSNAEFGYLSNVTSDIQAQIDSKASGVMSKFHIATNGSSEVVTDGSGLFFEGGSNISVAMTTSNGSGILTFNLISDPASSGNAFGVISTNSDVGYSWNNASDVTAIADGQALYIIPASGVRIDTDNTNSAIRIGVSGTLPDLESAPNISTIGTITTGTWNADTIGISKGGTGSTSFGAGEVIFMPDVGTALSSSSRMKFDGQTFTITHTAGPGITLENTDGDENGGLFKFTKDGSSPATNDEIGTIEWASEDSGSAGTTYAKIIGSIADVDAGSEQGALKFFVAELDGTLTEGLTITGVDNDGDVTVDITTHDGANGGLKLGGTLVTATAAELNALDGFTGSSIGSGTMSKFHVGSTTQASPTQISIGDGSGLFFAAGSNMTITTTNTDGSGVITFASTASGGGGTATSGNAFTTISAGGDSGYTWTSQNDIVAAGDADTLKLVAASGIRLDTDASSKAVRFSVSGALPLATHPSISAASSSDNASNTFIQDITLDAYGHITAIGTNTVPSGNYHPIIDSSNRLDATLIGANGNVSNTEFGYLASVSSDIQTQIDAKGSGTMSKFHVGVNGASEAVTDGSGLMFAAGNNVTISLEGNNGSGILTFSASAEGDARSVAGDTDNGLITWVTSDNTFAAESNLTYDGTTLKVAGLQGNNPGVPFIESDGIIYGSGISTGASGLRIAGVAVTSTAAELNILDGVTADANELNLLDGVTATTTELNYVDGVTSAIQTQLDAKGSGTMSRLKIGASDGLPQLQQLGDGSGIFFAAGDNMTIALTNNDAGSGIITFSSAVPVNNPTFTGNITIGSAEISETELEILDGATLTTTELNYVDGVTSAIQTQLDAKGSGTMSRLKIGASDGLPQLQQLGDGSGLFFAAGSNMSVTLTNSDAGSGILTFASAHPSISAASDSTNTGNTFIQSLGFDSNGHVTSVGTNTVPSGNYAPTADPTFTGVVTTPRLVVTALAGNTGGVPHIDSDGIIYGSGISAGPSGLRINGTAITSTAAELNILDGVTADANELNILDGVTATTAELNYVDGVSSAIQTQLDAKAAVASPTFTGVVTTPRLVVTALAGNTGGVPHIDSDGIIYGSGISAGPSGLRINGTAITATPAELNLIDGGATVGTTAVADGDGIIHNDDGTMRVTTVQTFDTYFAQTTKTLTNKTLTSPTITSPTITGTTTLASGVTIGLQANDSSDGYSLEVAGQIGASGVVVPPITASDGSTITFDLKRSSFHMVTLGGNRTLAVEDAKVGQKFMIRLQQDGAGSRTVTFFDGIRWAGGGTAPTLTTTANQADLFGFVATSGTTEFDGFIIGQNI